MGMPNETSNYVAGSNTPLFKPVCCKSHSAASQSFLNLSFHPEEKTASIAREQVILLSQKI